MNHHLKGEKRPFLPTLFYKVWSACSTVFLLHFCSYWCLKKDFESQKLHLMQKNKELRKISDKMHIYIILNHYDFFYSMQLRQLWSKSWRVFAWWRAVTWLSNPRSQELPLQRSPGTKMNAKLFQVSNHVQKSVAGKNGLCWSTLRDQIWFISFFITFEKVL